MKTERGFTLIEILVVVVIIGLLFSIVVPKVIQRPAQARQMKAKIQIKIFMQALEQFYMDNGFYPSTQQGLIALVKKPAQGKIPSHWIDGGYIASESIPRDPWGNDYIYVSPGDNDRVYEIRSLGADGQPGGDRGDADIYSWEIDVV